MRTLRGLLLALGLLVPLVAVTCCAPGPVDACCDETAACPIGGGDEGECGLAQSVAPAAPSLDASPVVVVVLPPTLEVARPSLDPGAVGPASGPPRASPAEVPGSTPLLL